MAAAAACSDLPNKVECYRRKVSEYGVMKSWLLPGGFLLVGGMLVFRAISGARVGLPALRRSYREELKGSLDHPRGRNE
jgi:hypothetical protein